MMQRIALMMASALWLMLPGTGWSQPAFLVVEKRVSQVPPSPLFYRLDTFPSLEAAEAAAGPYGLAGQTSDGRAWLFTLGPSGASSPGGTTVAEVGPLSAPPASEYLLRVQENITPPGRTGDVHTHPGAEGWFVLNGEQTIRTPAGMTRTVAGQAAVGPSGGTPLQLMANESVERHALSLFVLDAAQPMTSPAEFPPAGAAPAQPAPAAPAPPIAAPAPAPAQIPRPR